jgi:glutathione S-transferase
MDSSPKETSMKLYYAPNTCALATHIALVECGADYELVRVDFSTDEQRTDRYLAVNPKGRVPALATEQGVLTETPALLAYLAQRFPDSGLAPVSDPFAFARVQAWTSYLCSTVHVAHAHRMRGYRWVDDADAILAMQRKVPRSVGESFALAEQELSNGGWIMGDAFGIADIYLFTLAQWLEADGVDTTRLPKVLEHRQRVAARPATKRALAEEGQPPMA